MRGIETSAAEFDALGQSIGIENPYPSMTPGGGEGCIGCGSSGIFGIDDNSTIYVNGQRLSMTLDGARISYSSGMSLLYVGASAICPNNDCGPLRYQGTWTSPLVAGADGFLGYFVGSSQQTNRPRRSRGNKPTLKRAPKRTKADAEKANALAATGLFDEEVAEHYELTYDKVRLTKGEVETVRNNVLTEVGQNSICADFLEKIAKITLGKDVKAVDLLNEGINRVDNTLGFYWQNYPGAGGVATAHKIGSPHEHMGEIWFPTNKWDLISSRVVGAIHEIMHVAARASDIDLSRAVQTLGIEVVLDSGRKMEYPTDLNNDNQAYSGYWGQALKNHCGSGTINRRFVPK